MKYIMCSRTYPKRHTKAGQPTCFVEKILLGLYETKHISVSKCVELARIAGFDENHPMYYIDTLRGYDNSYLKYHTIRTGNRYKPGDMVSLRVWSDLPYRSKQIEFAQVEVKKTWSIEISAFWFINDELLEHEKVIELAKNDGLQYDDFIGWFNIHPIKSNEVFRGQIICWSDNIEYSKPSLIIENKDNE